MKKRTFEQTTEGGQKMREEIIIDQEIICGYSYQDLRALDYLYECNFQEDTKLPTIPNDLLLCNFDGHTIFSLFSQQTKALQAIYNDLIKQDFDYEVNSVGLSVQNKFLRKMHKILTLPVKDLDNVEEMNKI